MRLSAKRHIARWKICTGCGESKPLSSFSPNGLGKPRHTKCRSCHSRKAKDHYARNRDQVKQRQAEFRESKGSDYYVERQRIWRERNPDYYNRDIENQRRRGRIKASKRRALLAGVPAERIDPKVVFENSLGLCGVCGLAVDIERFDVDHIVPLARGGHHTYDNVQAAHPSCNYRKGAK